MAFVLKDVPKGKVVEMLTTECDWRMKSQLHYDKLEQKGISGSHWDNAIQRAILLEFGYADTGANLRQYQKIPGRYAKDKEVNDACFYIRFNIFERAVHKPGDVIPEGIMVHDFKTQNEVDIHDLIQGEKPVVIFAGSMT